MILNSNIWAATIETAKAKSEGNAAMLRSISRAVYEIQKASYWAFAAGILTIQSTTSRKLYTVDDAHTCEALANGHKFCKHTVARRLMQRYIERLGATEAQAETKRVQNWSAETGHVVVETKRASMLTEAGQAVMVKRTVKGEKYNGMDV